MSGEFDPTLELGFPTDKMLVCGCRGFLTCNDSVGDLCEDIMPNGRHFYDVLCRYDFLVTYVLGREEAVAGNVPKYALPFLKAHGASDNIIYERSKEDLRLMPEAKTSLEYLAALLPTYITSSAYEQTMLAIENALDVPLCESACAESGMDHCVLGRVASKKLRETADTISSLEIPDTKYRLNVPMSLDEKDIKIPSVLDEALGDGMVETGRAFMESCVPMNSSKKAYRLLDLRRQNGIDLDGTVYIGGDHTDYQILDLIRDGYGLSMAYNASDFAIRGSTITVISESATAGAFLTDVFYDKGIQAVTDLADSWSRGYLESGDVPDSNLKERLLSERTPFPKVYVTRKDNMEDLIEESEKARARLMRRRCAPAGIRTQVSASKGLNDWPLHHWSLDPPSATDL